MMGFCPVRLQSSKLRRSEARCPNLWGGTDSARLSPVIFLADSSLSCVPMA